MKSSILVYTKFSIYYLIFPIVNSPPRTLSPPKTLRMPKIPMFLYQDNLILVFGAVGVVILRLP